MKKRILSLTLTFTLLLSVLPLGAFNLTASATSENGFRYSVVNNEATINDYTGSVTNLTIPDTLGGYKVTSIGDHAFFNCTSLQSITIPNSVTSIGSSAFWNCTSLQSITIPNSVTGIGSSAFWGCTSLQSITIPNSVTSIGDRAFSDCTSLQSITIPNSVTSIGECAFDNTAYYNNTNNWQNGILYIGNHLIKAKERIFTCTIKTDTKTIADYAFSSCTSLKSIEIPNSVTSIGDDTFYNCTSLQSITIPNSVTSIGDYTFYNTAYYNNTNNWQNGILYIGNHLIKAKEHIFTCTIKTDTKTIAGSAFHNCTSLQSITIPNSVTSIGNYAFSGCTSLQSITIPNSVTSIGGSAFYDCTSLQSITIPNSVTSIGDYAFRNCTSLQSITIPNSVTSIGNWAFENCTSLQTVIYDGNEQDRAKITICSDNECLKNATWHYNSDHVYNWVVDTPASCYAAGVQHEECSVCHTKRNEDTPIAATGHNLVPVVDVQPSCVAGSQHLACTKCAHTDSWGTVIPSVNAHTSDNGKVTKKATTKADGKKVYSCTGCGAVLKTETLQKTVTAKSVKSTKKATVKITWKKDSKVKGYEIVYATNKKFTKGKKTITIKSNKTTSKTIKKLKAKKTYYVKIRSYKTVKGKKIYGAYSKVKKVKVK